MHLLLSRLQPLNIFNVFFQSVPVSHCFVLTWLIDSTEETGLVLGVLLWQS